MPWWIRERYDAMAIWASARVMSQRATGAPVGAGDAKSGVARFATRCWTMSRARDSRECIARRSHPMPGLDDEEPADNFDGRLRSSRLRRPRRCTDRLATHEGLPDEHRAAAVRADRARLAGVDLGVAVQSLRVGRGYCVEQLARSRQVGLATAVGEQPVVADVMEAAGQDVQQEATHELVRIERHRLVMPLVLGAVVLPAEGDAVLVESDEPTVGDGDAVRIDR